MTKYFVDDAGVYLGGFDGVEPPVNSIEITEPPTDGRMVLTDSVWAMPSNITNEIKDLNARNRLREIDIESLRSIREFMLSEFGTNPNLDPKLQQLEDEAVTKRLDVR